jgi:twinkle protein
MKYQSSNTKLIIEHDWGTKKAKHTCPECSKSRRNKSEKCLEYYPETDSAYCFHCNTTFFKYDPHRTEKVYAVPEWKNKTGLSDKAAKYFESRMIPQKTINEFKIYTDTEWMPQFGKEIEVICFPYFKNGTLTNIKYRGAKKSFKMVSNAELIFFNYDQIGKTDSIIITEGEIDALAFHTVGHENVISVPNGANKNLEYLDPCIELFNGVQTVYLATDTDTKGVELRDELARRIGPEKCRIVSFKNCKDANEYLISYGGIELFNTIENAHQYPVKGLITAEDIYQDIRSLYENGVQPGQMIDVPVVDQHVTWETGRLAIVTGIPGSGKSEFVDYLIVRLNLLHGWKAGFFTPENYPLKYHYSKIFEKIIGKQFSRYKASDIDFNMAYEYIKENYFYVMNEEDTTVESVIESAKALIKSRGIKIFVIDPYNRLDHRYTDSETQYISRFLDKLTSFARYNNILIFLVAHPTKLKKNTAGKYDVPTLYDIAGSANFYNKTDYGFTVHRMTNEENIMQNEIAVYWQKIKFKHLGKQGVSDLKYNYNNGRFVENSQSIEMWDNSSWLTAGEQPQDVFGTQSTVGYEEPYVDPF